LARQLRRGQLVVKLFLPYPLHAKLYLLFRDDVNNPVTGFVGSSNLTLAGLSRHGELNVDVLDHLGTQQLSAWFNARWQERWALDVSSDLATLIENSWAREEAIPPHHIYLNIAYHLSTSSGCRDALRTNCSNFRKAPSKSPRATCTAVAA
jgi:phosphatidylserine/phosphatidylglycerophosphate/cardiolipin synthase-like enzyme